MNTDRYLITRNIGESFQEYCDVNNTNVESERIDDVEGVEEKDAIAPMRRKNSGRDHLKGTVRRGLLYCFICSIYE